MAPLIHHLCFKKSLLMLSLLSLIFITPSLISAHNQIQPKRHHLSGITTTRALLEELDENNGDEPIISSKKKPTTSSSSPKKTTKNHQTNLTKPTSSNPPKNQTKPIKTSLNSSSSKSNKTKPITKTSSPKNPVPPTTKSQPKNLNHNSTSHLTNKSSDLPNNKTSKSKEAKAQPEKKPDQAAQLKTKPSWIDDDDDLVSEFRDLPLKFQETIVPDLEKISKTSQIYLNRYNREFTKGFKPYVGNKYASTLASLALFAVILVPLVIVSVVFNRIKAYFSLQKVLIFVQIYLAIYFTILCLSCLATGLEPLRFFYSTSRSTYVCVQVLQTLAYVLYLLLLLMYLVLVFSTETGLATKVLGLGQTFVGLAVGLHYYMTVFHRVVLRQPPKSSWKAHGLYATCFVVICLLGRVDRRKKAYLEEGGGEGKKN